MCKCGMCWDKLDEAAEREGSGLKKAPISVNLPRRRHFEYRPDQVKVIREGRHVLVKVGHKKYPIC